VIALVGGDVAVRRPDHVVVETASGVGYRLGVSAETLRQVPAVGHAVSLHAHLIVRDDALMLYGFATEEERDLFLLLIGVQSVGPKVAQAVLSGGSPRELIAALVAGDAGRFQAVPGIGKRTAERIVAELREKVGVPDLEVPEISVRRGDDPRVLARILKGKAMSDRDYIELVQARREWIEAVEASTAGFDALLSPTLSVVAPPIADVAPGAERDEAFFRINALMVRNTSVVNMLDGCALTLPCHRPDQLPVGLMVWHGCMRDDAVLCTALQVETALKGVGADRKPTRL